MKPFMQVAIIVAFILGGSATILRADDESGKKENPPRKLPKVCATASARSESAANEEASRELTKKLNEYGDVTWGPIERTVMTFEEVPLANRVCMDFLLTLGTCGCYALTIPGGTDEVVCGILGQKREYTQVTLCRTMTYWEPDPWMSRSPTIP